ncbi:MAG: zinc-binding dehydrogenase, partial [Kiritimatiellia bacterium]
GIPMRFPVVPGHEFAGVVTAVGPGVEDLQPGARVTAENTRYNCGICPQCAAGSYNLCSKRLATGYAFDGAFASAVVVPRSRIHLLPDAVDFRAGALTDPSACAYHAVQELTGVNAGDVVLVSGPGPMGLFCLQYVKANGGTVILTGATRDRQRLELGRELGADHVCTAETAEDFIMQITNGVGVDRVLECSGAQAAAQLGLSLLRSEGVYTQVGIFGKPITFDLDRILYREIRLLGSFSQKFVGWEKALELCAAGRIQVSPMITHIFSLKDWREAFDLFESGAAIKVIFEFH